MSSSRAIARWVLIALVLLGGVWLYRLILGQPFQINHFFERVALREVLIDPERLTHIGLVDGGWLDFHSGKLTDGSPRQYDARIALQHAAAETFAGYERASLSPQEQISYDVFQWQVDRQRAEERFRYHPYPVSQMFGDHTETAKLLLNFQKLDDARGAHRYIERLRGFGAKFDGLVETLRERAAKGFVAPRFALEKSLVQIKELIAPQAEAHVLVKHLVAKMAVVDIQPAERDRLRLEAIAAMEQMVYPAYRRLAAELEHQLAKSDDAPGVWRLPDGDAYYAHRLRTMTTTELTPEQVHGIGLSEVARITAEMEAILHKAGYAEGSVTERMKILAREPRFLKPNDAAGKTAVIAEYKQLLKAADAALDKAFAVRPKAPLDVLPVAAFEEKQAAGAYYDAPALDSSRGGVFRANLRSTGEHPSWAMSTLAWHEGLPGHHLQIAIQQEIEGLPTFRKVGFNAAYGEGWALYAERLGAELGLERDAFDSLGRLQAELFRAARLVVDTGIHYKRWSRSEAQRYFSQATGRADAEIEAEVDRYAVWPGQACAYKIGMLKILELRTRAQAGLGTKFDLRLFHQVVLESGTIPLTLLERRVDAWIARGGSI